MRSVYGRGDTDPIEMLTLEKRQSGGKKSSEEEAERKRRAERQLSMYKEFQELKKKFNTTEADANGDVRTILRRLDRRLFLLVRSKATGKWNFPMAEYDMKKDQTLRATAERAVELQVGRKYLHVWMVGNAPMGWNALNEKNQHDLASRVFYFDSELVWDDGGKLPSVKDFLSPEKNDKHVIESISDFAWLSKPELPEYLDDTTNASAQRMLCEF